ncbi:hypothetical protein TNCV_473891 [Trichonephila clavipes]|nr:hypothetical protein TNCV_473891 [Trichonephila clavipes]
MSIEKTVRLHKHHYKIHILAESDERYVRLQQYGVICHTSRDKLLPTNRTINSEVYYHPLDKLNELKLLLKQERQKLINSNGEIIMSGNSQQKLLHLQRDILLHLPFCSDMAPSD